LSKAEATQSSQAAGSGSDDREHQGIGMARTVSEIIVAIEAFQPSDGKWLPLDALLEELFQSGSASNGIDAMLHVFERYPTDDGAGVFWAILHGLESLPGQYETKLVQSLRRIPSRMALTMVCRLLNGGPTASFMALEPRMNELAALGAGFRGICGFLGHLILLAVEENLPLSRTGGNVNLGAGCICGKGLITGAADGKMAVKGNAGLGHGAKLGSTPSVIRETPDERTRMADLQQSGVDACFC
jgi:hypothetical protein